MRDRNPNFTRERDAELSGLPLLPRRTVPTVGRRISLDRPGKVSPPKLWVDGIPYPSINAAAKANQISTSCLCGAVNDGLTEYRGHRIELAEGKA